MAKLEIDLLEEYIALESKEAREDAQLADLCDLVDEIRALHPPMPAPDFVERTVDRIAANMDCRPAKGKIYRLWFKTAGWTSAAVAAVLLITIGVLPHKPSDQLPAVPIIPIQQIAPAPVDTLRMPAGTETGENKQNVIESPSADKTVKPQIPQSGKTETLRAGTAEPSVQPAPPMVADNVKIQKSFVQGEIYQEKSLPPAPERRSYSKSGNTSGTKSAGEGFSALQQPRHDARVAGGTGPAVADIQSRVPFKMLTLPEYAPVQAEVADSPPGVTMTYLVDQHEIVIRQWLQEQADLAMQEPGVDRKVVLQRGDVIVEVSGDTEPAVLEEVARNLK